MKYRTITMSREYGSGGRTVGKKLAKELGIPFYDKEIIQLTARKSGFSEKVIEQVEGKRTGSLLYSLYMTTQELPVNDQIFIAQSNIIRAIHEEGPSVIVGRCADYTLRETEDCLRVFIHAPLEERVRRVREEYGVDEKNLEAHVRREDKNRASYYSHFTQQKWGAAKDHHLTIDSSIGLEAVVGVIKAVYQGEFE